MFYTEQTVRFVFKVKTEVGVADICFNVSSLKSIHDADSRDKPGRRNSLEHSTFAKVTLRK